MQAVHLCCRRRLPLAVQTKAEQELGLAAGAKQTDMWQHLYNAGAQLTLPWGIASHPISSWMLDLPGKGSVRFVLPTGQK